MTSNCNTIVRRDVTLGDLVPGAVIYRKESGKRRTIWKVTRDCVHYTTCGYDLIHHPEYGVLVNYEIEDNTMPAPSGDEVTTVRRPVTRDDLKRGRGLVMYNKSTGVRKMVVNVDDIFVEYNDGSTIPIDGENGVLENYEVEEIKLIVPQDEVDQLIKLRSNGTYAQISDDASKIIDTLGTGDNFAYFYSQIANKLARIKHGYSVEDSLLDIAGYAKLELEKLRDSE